MKKYIVGFLLGSIIFSSTVLYAKTNEDETLVNAAQYIEYATSVNNFADILLSKASIASSIYLRGIYLQEKRQTELLESINSKLK